MKNLASRLTFTGLLISVVASAQLPQTGTVVGWGINTTGQATGVPSGPATGIVAVAGLMLTNARTVSAGQYYSLALKADGTLLCWGDPFFAGSQADGKVAFHAKPIASVAAVSAGSPSLCLRSDGTVVSFGRGAFGKAREGIIPGISNAIAVAAGLDRGLALGANGTIFIWGERSEPPSSLTNASAIAVSKSMNGHGLALLPDRTVVAWGLSDGSASRVVGATNVIAIAAGRAHYLALKNDGTVAEWGWYDPMGISENGIAGLPAVNLRSHLVMIGGKVLTNVAAISAGMSHSMALKLDGTLVVWGDKLPEQMGVPAGLSGVIAISAGDCFSLALTTNNTALLSFAR